MAYIDSAMPKTYMPGVRDIIPEEQVYEPIALPTHLPVFFTYAQKGPTDDYMIVVGNSMTNMYGTETFDERSPWATHATVGINKANSKGNQLMIKRIKPTDAAPPSNFRLVADVLATKIKDYERMPDGSPKYDPMGELIYTGEEFSGHSVKFVVEHIELGMDDESMFGKGVMSAGDQTDPLTSTQSERYPIMDIEVSSFGKWGDLQGVTMFAPTAKSRNPMNENMLDNYKVFPFRIGCVYKTSETATARSLLSNDGMQYLDVVWKEGVIDTDTNLTWSVGDVFLDNYRNLEPDNDAPPRFGPFGDMHVYNEYLDILIKKFYDAEKPANTMTSDFDGSDGEEYRFNFMGGCDSNEVPYFSYQIISTGSDAIRFTENTRIFALGGDDGTMNEAEFAKLVADELMDWADPDHPVSDMRKYPASIFWDTGFPMDTKYAAAKFIANRKDTAVVLSTHVCGERPLNASEDSSRAISLRARVAAYPESEWYGTSILRASIVMRSGKLINSFYKNHLPISVELLEKSAAYMGASDGTWKHSEQFSTYPKSILSSFKEVNVVFTPESTRRKDWSNGLVWVEQFDVRKLYFPVFRTVYEEERSVLTSFFTMMACVELEKQGHEIRIEMTGTDNLTDAQFLERVVDKAKEKLKGKFDDRFVITPSAYMTAADKNRGYSWVLRYDLEAGMVRTVQTLEITAQRFKSDTETAA